MIAIEAVNSAVEAVEAVETVVEEDVEERVSLDWEDGSDDEEDAEVIPAEEDLEFQRSVIDVSVHVECRNLCQIIQYRWTSCQCSSLSHHRLFERTQTFFRRMMRRRRSRRA